MDQESIDFQVPYVFPDFWMAIYRIYYPEYIFMLFKKCVIVHVWM